MKNNFSFLYNNNLIANVDCLFLFIKQSIPLDAFFQKLPKSILNAKLAKLKFESEKRENIEYFVIKFKDPNKTKKIKFTNNCLSPFGITITDKSQLIYKISDDESLNPKLTLKESLKKHISLYTQKINRLSIDNILTEMEENGLKSYQDVDEQIKITFFFIFLKIYIQRSTLFKSKHFVSSESLINLAKYSTTLFVSDINNIITYLNEDITFTNKLIQESQKKRQQINISKMVFSYHLLYTKLTDLIPSASKKDIEAILDSIILKYIDRNTVSKYNFFKKAYFLEKGFVYLFSGYDNEPIQKCQDKLDYHKKNIQTFLQLIEELTTNVNKMPKIIDLAIILKEKTNIYFQSLLHNSISNQTNLSSDTELFEKFSLDIKKEISNFQKKYFYKDEIEIKGILNKILNILAKLAPKFLISKENRNMFFHRRTIGSKLFDKIENFTQIMTLK